MLTVTQSAAVTESSRTQTLFRRSSGRCNHSMSVRALHHHPVILSRCIAGHAIQYPRHAARHLDGPSTCQRAVSRPLDRPPTVARQSWFKALGAMFPQARDCGTLVQSHRAGIADHMAATIAASRRCSRGSAISPASPTRIVEGLDLLGNDRADAVHSCLMALLRLGAISDSGPQSVEKRTLITPRSPLRFMSTHPKQRVSDRNPL
jgi:hypothetical protein